MSTLQQQIHSLAEQLETLAAQIREPEQVSGTELDKIIMQAMNNPFKHHVLEVQDDYLKLLYIKILLSIVHLSGNAKLERYSIVAKIYYSLGLEESLYAQIPKSQMLTLQDFSQFYMLLKDSEIKNVFLIDALMLLSIHIDKQTNDYVTDLIANLEVSEADFIQACRIVKAILTVNDEALKEIFTEKSLFQTSADHFLIAIQSTCAAHIVIEGNDTQVVDIQDFTTQNLTLKNVMIKLPENVVISQLKKLELINCSISSENLNVTFQDIPDIHFKNIDFKQCKELSTIKIQRCTNVTLEDIEITNRTIHANRLFEVNQVENLAVLKSTFEGLNLLAPSKTSTNSIFPSYLFSPNQTEQSSIILATEVINVQKENIKLIDCKLKDNYKVVELEKIIYQE